MTTRIFSMSEDEVRRQLETRLSTEKETERFAHDLAAEFGLDLRNTHGALLPQYGLKLLKKESWSDAFHDENWSNKDIQDIDDARLWTVARNYAYATFNVAYYLDGLKCRYCDAPTTKLPKVDHIFPFWRGKNKSLREFTVLYHVCNLALACASCNSKKSNRLLPNEHLPPITRSEREQQISAVRGALHAGKLVRPNEEAWRNSLQTSLKRSMRNQAAPPDAAPTPQSQHPTSGATNQLMDTILTTAAYAKAGLNSAATAALATAQELKLDQHAKAQLLSVIQWLDDTNNTLLRSPGRTTQTPWSGHGS